MTCNYYWDLRQIFFNDLEVDFYELLPEKTCHEMEYWT